MVVWGVNGAGSPMDSPMDRHVWVYPRPKLHTAYTPVLVLFDHLLEFFICEALAQLLTASHRASREASRGGVPVRLMLVNDLRIVTLYI